MHDHQPVLLEMLLVPHNGIEMCSVNTTTVDERCGSAHANHIGR